MLGQTIITGQETPAIARSIIDGSMSPYCPGLTLASCPSPSADSLRRAIIDRVNAGESRASIMTSLTAHYGDAIRAAPSTTGFGLVGWLMPFVLLVFGGLWMNRWIRRAARAGASNDPERQPVARG